MPHVTVTGTVHVDNQPAVQPVAGTQATNVAPAGPNALPVLPAVVRANPAPATDGRAVALSVDSLGALRITGTITQVAGAPTGTSYVTSSQAAPVWITQSGGGGAVNVTNVPLPVTSTQASPVWVTGSVTVNTGTGGSSNVSITASIGLTASVSNFPAVQTVTGTVHVDNPATTVTVTGTAGSVGVTGSVNVTNFPATQTVAGTVTVTSSQGNPVAVTGVQAISNFPASQTVAGTVTANQGTAGAAPWPVSSTQGSVVTASIPAAVTVTASFSSPVTVAVSGSLIAVISGTVPVTSSQTAPVWITGAVGVVAGTSLTASITGVVAVSQTNTPAGTQAVTGTVHIDNSPVTVTGTITAAVSNFPATQTVTGTVHIDNNPVTVTGTITAAISNFPATQTVTGTVHIDNSPVTVTSSAGNPVTVTGSVNVTNFPASQTVAGTVTANQGSAAAAPWPVSSTQGSVVTASVPGTVTVTASAPVWISGSVTGSVGVSNFPAVTVVTGNVNNPVWVTATLLGITGSVTASIPGTVAVSQTNVPFGPQVVTSSQAAPLWVTGTQLGVTGSVTTLQGSVVTASLPGLQTTPDGLLRTSLGAPGTVDVFGQLVTAVRMPQVQAQFFSVPPASQVIILTTGGATATGPTSGVGVFQTTTAATARVTGTSPAGVVYTAHYEIYAAWTWQFTLPTSAATYQRAGLYNATDGFFVGFSGTNFGITARFNGVDTFVSQSGWNGDRLNGAAGSAFTSASAPVAFDPTKLNIYRVRLGWLGAATAFFEIAAPDGDWVPLHTVRFPNSLSGRASITTPNLPFTFDINKSAADATNLVGYCGCFVGGITSYSDSALLDWNNTTYTALGSNAAFTGSATDALGYSSVLVSAFSNQSSAANGVVLQFSIDGQNWDEQESNTFTAGGNALTLVAPVRGRFVRVIYQNAASAQGSLRLVTVLRTLPGFGDILELADIPSVNNHAQLVKAQLVGKVTNGPASGTFLDVRVNPAGNLTTANTSVGTVGTAGTDVTAIGYLSGGNFQAVSGTSGSIFVVSSQANPVWITSSAGGTAGVITGTVHIDNAPANNVSGTLLVTSTLAQPVWVTGTVSISDPGTSITVDSNMGALGVSGTVTVTGAAGSVGITGTVHVDNPVTTVTVGGGSIGGFVASGSQAGNVQPILVGGVDAGSKVHTVLTDAAGAVFVTASAVTVITVSQSNTPAGTQTVGGTVTAGQGTAGAAPWPVSSTQGSVVTASIPGTVTVSVSNSPSVSVSNFPGTQTVAGTVTANQGTSAAAPWAVSSTQGSVVTASIPATVTVSVSNSPSVSVSNFPAVTVVTGNQNNPVWVAFNSPSVNQGTAGAAPWPVSSTQGSVVTASIPGTVTVSVSNTPTVTANQGSAGATAWPVTGTVPNAVPVVEVAVAAGGGASVYQIVAAASNNAAAIKASPGQVYGWYINNVSAGWRYVKLYNKASAPAPASDTVVLSLGVPGGGGSNLWLAAGLNFSTGIAIAVVSGSSNTDNTSVGANDLVVNIFYK